MPLLPPSAPHSARPRPTTRAAFHHNAPSGSPVASEPRSKVGRRTRVATAMSSRATKRRRGATDRTAECRNAEDLNDPGATRGPGRRALVSPGVAHRREGNGRCPGPAVFGASCRCLLLSQCKGGCCVAIVCGCVVSRCLVCVWIWHLARQAWCCVGCTAEMCAHTPPTTVTGFRQVGRRGWDTWYVRRLPTSRFNRSPPRPRYALVRDRPSQIAQTFPNSANGAPPCRTSAAPPGSLLEELRPCRLLREEGPLRHDDPKSRPWPWARPRGDVGGKPSRGSADNARALPARCSNGAATTRKR